MPFAFSLALSTGLTPQAGPLSGCECLQMRDMYAASSDATVRPYPEAVEGGGVALPPAVVGRVQGAGEQLLPGGS